MSVSNQVSLVITKLNIFRSLSAFLGSLSGSVLPFLRAHSFHILTHSPAVYPAPLNPLHICFHLPAEVSLWAALSHLPDHRGTQTPLGSTADVGDLSLPRGASWTSTQYSIPPIHLPTSVQVAARPLRQHISAITSLCGPAGSQRCNPRHPRTTVHPAG